MMTTMIMMTVMTTMMTEMMMMIRYELPPPPPGKMTDLQAWTECVENSEAQLEHQRTRIMNLDLMLDYGGESWKQYNDVLQVRGEYNAYPGSRIDSGWNGLWDFFSTFCLKI